MMRQDGGLPGGGIDVGVDLGREDGFVAEHLLDDPQVGPAFDQVGGEGMTESVRRNLLVDARGHRPFLHEVEDGYAAERTAEMVQEKDVLVGAGGWLGPDGKILGEFKPTGAMPTWYDQLSGRGIKCDPKMFDPDSNVNVTLERTR